MESALVKYAAVAKSSCACGGGSECARSGLLAQGASNVHAVGIGKSDYHSSLGDITEGVDAPFVEDASPLHAVWL